MNNYQVSIAINEEPLLKIVEENIPNGTIFSDDSCLYGVLVVQIKSKNQKELLSYFNKLQIYKDDLILIEKVEEDLWKQLKKSE